MRRRSWLVGLVLVVVASTVGATSAFAQSSTVPDGYWGDTAAHCPGMSGNGGMMGNWYR